MWPHEWLVKHGRNFDSGIVEAMSMLVRAVTFGYTPTSHPHRGAHAADRGSPSFFVVSLIHYSARTQEDVTVQIPTGHVHRAIENKHQEIGGNYDGGT